MKNVFRYPGDLVEPLKTQWYQWYSREIDAPALPSNETLNRLLEIAYHASFTADEQRGTSFEAVLGATEEVYDPLRIDPRRQFSPHEIMRLAPAASASKTMLAVDTSSREPLIWALCSGAFMFLKVTVLGPGSMRLGRNERTFVTLHDGHLATARALTGVYPAIREVLETANTILWEGIDPPIATWSPPDVVYPDFLESILESIKLRGHGGTVLMIPDDEWHSSNWRRLLRVKYSCNDTSFWPALRKLAELYDEKVIARLSYEFTSAEESVRKLASRLAGLTSVDGAVLVTDRLRILGFGVEVTTSSDLDLVETPDGSKSNVEAYGTRHRSAFRFCAAYPQGAAFVCSQDGTVRCVRSKDGGVALWY